MSNEPILFNSHTKEWSWLSNFSPHPIFQFPTVEHAYQACKSTDPAEWSEIAAMLNPKAAKACSYRIKHRRPKWDEIKLNVMRRALRIKFQDSELRQKILDTGSRELIHYAPWGDTFWGVDQNLTGQNIQGKLLMELRDELSNSS